MLMPYSGQHSSAADTVAEVPEDSEAAAVSEDSEAAVSAAAVPEEAGRILLCALEGFDDFRHQRVAYHIFCPEIDYGDSFDILYQLYAAQQA